MQDANRPARYALYYTPPPGSALAMFGDRVVGGALPGLAEAEHSVFAKLTTAPRIYGFHATLRAPMRLRDDVAEAEIVKVCKALACHRDPLRIGRLDVVLLDGFAALVPSNPPAELNLLAAECVAALDPLRAPLNAMEWNKRRPEALDPRRRALLERWGYPYVFEAFRFHMTLTGLIPAESRETWRARLAEVYEPGADLVIDALTLLRQDEGAPFRILRRIPFTP
ncbi:MAG: DUF1045 domain-containing protein [Methylobacterium sp.]|uniref:DUF1045 domain-containing protein n=1 Tax=Methylobacterium sp. TaxID=409 RepID=UPI0025CC17B5|nr:DUF1045 domain-containing protein [Methylobacterium sp.]MBX9932482.1 DUF1045 domain-containing protein [Methylobacterium sp.]